jgi:hypothetical protein
MPKPSTMPFIIDKAKEISITSLKKWNYLKPNIKKNGSIKWKINGIETSSCTIAIFMNESRGMLTLIYTSNEIKYNYNIEIISKTSNLGKGKVFSFVCPFTYKVCRKLHLYNGRFIHRSVIIGGMYSKQIQTKNWRQMENIYRTYFDKEEYYDILYSKHFKKFYNGVPTKKYLKVIEKINDGS